MRLLVSGVRLAEVVRLLEAYLVICAYNYGPGYLAVWDTEAGDEPGGQRVSGPHAVIPRLAAATG